LIQILILYFRYFNINVQDFTVQLDRTFVVNMHKTLSPFLVVFECPLDARFRQDVSSLHASNIPPVKALIFISLIKFQYYILIY